MVQDLRYSFLALLTGSLLWSGCAFAQNSSDSVSVNVNISADEIAAKVIQGLDPRIAVLLADQKAREDSIDLKIKVLTDQNETLIKKISELESRYDSLVEQNNALLVSLKKDQVEIDAQLKVLAARFDDTSKHISTINVGPTNIEIGKAVTQELKNAAPPRFQLLGLNVGPTSGGNATFTGKGRYFAPFGDRYGFQSEGEYFYLSLIHI